VERRGDDLVITVRVVPRASCNEISGPHDGVLRIRTTAPPADGKANKATTRLLAKFLDVPPSSITLLRGQTSRNKQFLVRNATDKL
jgi:uncharacterized protein (TIGR00251 family)